MIWIAKQLLCCALLNQVAVCCMLWPGRYYFGYMIASYKMANVEVSDARVLRMHEVLLAIKLVKFYVWERSFARQVEEVSAPTQAVPALQLRHQPAQPPTELWVQGLGSPAAQRRVVATSKVGPPDCTQCPHAAKRSYNQQCSVLHEVSPQSLPCITECLISMAPQGCVSLQLC
jgi:hypothetical protein